MSSEELFLASVKKERKGPGHYRWKHARDDFYREIDLKKCIYCGNDKPCFNPHVGENASKSLTFCQNCINHMFNQSALTKEERIEQLHNQQQQMKEDKIKRKVLKQKEKSKRHAKKLRNKMEEEAIEKELALLLKKE